jgi:tRNA1Val (adenine37-N6)-methyltransferase
MPNDFFQFKQFLIKQDKCAMKVCTDSCILGAYPNVSTKNNILDIGTGTGLLALMLAQCTQAKIDAIEIDEQAYHQAVENVVNSPWCEQINVFHQSIQDYTLAKTTQYDFIICNPPFFENHLKSGKVQTDTALHSASLNFDELLHSVNLLLLPKGEFVVLLPEYQADVLAEKAKGYGLYPSQKQLIFNRLKDGKDERVFRMIQVFTHQEKKYSIEKLYIRDAENAYTEQFKALLSAYYLIF